MKLVSSPFAELSVGTIAGIAGGMISGGTPLATLAAAGTGTVSAFIMKLASAHQSKERQDKKIRKDIICKITTSL